MSLNGGQKADFTFLSERGVTKFKRKFVPFRLDPHQLLRSSFEALPLTDPTEQFAFTGWFSCTLYKCLGHCNQSLFHKEVQSAFKHFIFSYLQTTCMVETFGIGDQARRNSE